MPKTMTLDYRVPSHLRADLVRPSSGAARFTRLLLAEVDNNLPIDSRLSKRGAWSTALAAISNV